MSSLAQWDGQGTGQLPKNQVHPCPDSQGLSESHLYVSWHALSLNAEQLRTGLPIQSWTKHGQLHPLPQDCRPPRWEVTQISTSLHISLTCNSALHRGAILTTEALDSVGTQHGSSSHLSFGQEVGGRHAMPSSHM